MFPRTGRVRAVFAGFSPVWEDTVSGIWQVPKTGRSPCRFPGLFFVFGRNPHFLQDKFLTCQITPCFWHGFFLFVGRYEGKSPILSREWLYPLFVLLPYVYFPDGLGWIANRCRNGPDFVPLPFFTLVRVVLCSF